MSKQNQIVRNQAALLKVREEVTQQVTDHEKQVLICMDLLEGKIGRPPMIFGLFLDVVPNYVEGRSAVVGIRSITPDCLLSGGLPNRFGMEIKDLHTNPDKKTEWNNTGEEILSRYLHTQSPFKEAKKRLYEEREERRLIELQQQEKQQQALLESLKKPVAQKLLISGELDETILTRTQPYVFQDPSGAIFRLYFTPQRNLWRIRVVSAPEGHTLMEAANLQSFIKRDDLVEYSTEDDTVVEGIYAFPRQVREYLRAALRAMGKYPVAMVPETETNTTEVQEPAAAVQVKTKVATIQAVDVSQELGVNALPTICGRKSPAKGKRRLNGHDKHA